MKCFKTYKNLPEEVRGAVIAIGNFDGVHRGHKALLDAAKKIASAEDTHAAVLTFEPHPRRLFRPDEPPGRLTPPEMKAWRLEEYGMDVLFSLPFDWDFASQSAQDFIQNVLSDGLGASHIVIGHDFRFGQLRKGGAEEIKAAGLPVTVVEPAADKNGETYSSSAARQALRHGDIEKANEILGWEWEVQGEIVRGDQRGRTLGFPTANVHLHDTVHPAYGIYAARVQIEGEDEWHKAAVNVGIRPMFEIPTAQVEAHILDFDRDIYGKILRVKLVRRLRSEARFDSLDALTAQMTADCAQARDVLS